MIDSPKQGKALSREFVCRNFATALLYLNKAGAIAEEQGHHPDLHITGYRTVTTVVYTHSTGGLCLNDFILASKLDEIIIDYSPKFLKKHPNACGQRLQAEASKISSK
jgi:4a-hydroxytetrahydrobiopterin dehydratase